jgi:hypothetical protein
MVYVTLVANKNNIRALFQQKEQPLTITPPEKSVI